MPVVDDLTAFLEIFDCAMDVPWFPAEFRPADGSRVRNHSQLVLLDINSMLVEGTRGPPHDVSHRSRVNRQDRGAQNHGQWVETVGVSWIVQEDGELKSMSQPSRFRDRGSTQTESSTPGCPMPRMFCLKAVNDSGCPNKTIAWSMRWDPKS